MNTFHLRIVTMDGKVFDDQASQIFLRTIDGDVAIRAGHINYCSGIGMGQAHVTLADGHERYAACIGGMVSMLNGECQVAATTWEWKEEIDEERAKKAKERARGAPESEKSFRQRAKNCRGKASQSTSPASCNKRRIKKSPVWHGCARWGIFFIPVRKFYEEALR